MEKKKKMNLCSQIMSDFLKTMVNSLLLLKGIKEMIMIKTQTEWVPQEILR
jgi:hypothetical protein